MATVPQFFWNNFTQRVLSQSNNISYAARGIYRVHDTEPNRKGDYWFRDFGMVMACAYMTELGFRGVETLYTMPLATEAMNLHRLSELKHPINAKQALYPGARNYRALPEIVRERAMGTLIRNSSNLLPNLMKELELQHGQELPEELKASVKELLTNPTVNAEKVMAPHLQKTGLSMTEVQKISRIENNARRLEAIESLLQKHTKLDSKTVLNVVKLEDARQMGILIDHLQKNLNFSEYLKEKYLSNHKLSGTVSEVVQEYADKLTALQSKSKEDLPVLLQDLLKLPVDKREDELARRFQEVASSLELRKGVLLATEQDRQALNHLHETIKTQVTDPKGSVDLPELEKQIGSFCRQLKQRQAQHLEALWNYAVPDIKTKLSQKIEEAVESVRKLKPDQNRHQALWEKLTELGVDSLVPENKRVNVLARLREGIEQALPHDPAAYVTDAHLNAAKGHIRAFMQETHPGADGLLGVLMTQAGRTSQEFRRLIVDSMNSKTMSAAIGKIQKNGTWPKMAATVLLNLFFYGFLASNFDNKILQPFQKKLVAERGTAQDIVTAGYWGVVPGLAMLTQLADKTSLPLFRKMGYFNRFAVVGGAALAAFAGSTYAILMHRLKSPPASTNVTPAAQSPGSFYQPGRLTFNANQPISGSTAASTRQRAFTFPAWQTSKPTGTQNFTLQQQSPVSFTGMRQAGFVWESQKTKPL
jgi:hypothetical protein